MLSVPSAEATETADFEPGLEGRRPAIPQTASLPAARGCSTATPKADQKSARPARRYLPDDPYVAATGPDPASTSKPNASALQARASAAMDRAQRMHPDLEASRRPHVSPQRRRQGFATGLARSHPSSRGLQALPRLTASTCTASRVCQGSPVRPSSRRLTAGCRTAAAYTRIARSSYREGIVGGLSATVSAPQTACACKADEAPY